MKEDVKEILGTMMLAILVCIIVFLVSLASVKAYEDTIELDNEYMVMIIKPIILNLPRKPYKINSSKEQQEKVLYAWEISKDAKFIYMLEAENGLWSPLRKSIMIGANGYSDSGLCMINRGYHPHIVNDKRFSDWKWQLRKCLELYKNGIRFYGLDNIGITKKHFEWK